MEKSPIQKGIGWVEACYELHTIEASVYRFISFHRMLVVAVVVLVLDDNDLLLL